MQIEKGDRIRIVNDKWKIMHVFVPSTGLYFVPPSDWEDIVESTPYWYNPTIKYDEARFATLKNWFFGYDEKFLTTPSIGPESIIKI